VTVCLLAGATLTVSGLQLGWVEPAETHTVALVVLGFTVPTQLLAAVFGFLGRDGATATGMGLLAGIWLAVGLVTLQAQPGSDGDARSPAVEEVAQIRLEAVRCHERHEFDARHLLRLNVTATPQDPRQGHPIGHGEERVVNRSSELDRVL